MNKMARTNDVYEQRSEKLRVYSAPELRVYGALHRVTQGSLDVGEDADGTHTKNQRSDRLCKERIVRVGHHPAGFGLYLFDYKPEFRDTWGHGRQFGVMADEVEKVFPESVSVHPDGYKMVNYAMLGISRNVVH